MWGVSSDYGDSGGVQYEGEQGRDDGGGGDDPGGGGGGKKNHAKCIGPHCAETPYGLLLVIGFGCASMVYLVAGTYFGYQQGLSGTAALPNSYFWANLGGLVKVPPPPPSPAPSLLGLREPNEKSTGLAQILGQLQASNKVFQSKFWKTCKFWADPVDFAFQLNQRSFTPQRL
jgi:hypothetical protein